MRCNSSQDRLGKNIPLSCPGTPNQVQRRLTLQTPQKLMQLKKQNTETEPENFDHQSTAQQAKPPRFMRCDSLVFLPEMRGRASQLNQLSLQQSSQDRSWRSTSRKRTTVPNIVKSREPSSRRRSPYQLIQQQTIQEPQYFDDEQVPKSNECLDLSRAVEFMLTPRNRLQQQKVDDKQRREMAIITLKCQNLLFQRTMHLFGVDIICLIDISATMQGKKLMMVKSSIQVLLDSLGENDRLCLISFNDQAERLTPLLKCTSESKTRFKDILQNIYPIPNAQLKSIAKGTEIAFNVIKQRNQSNQPTSIFLISDGKDFEAEKLVKMQLENNNLNFSIHTFAVGADCNVEVMAALCRLRAGNVYYAHDSYFLVQYVLFALGGLKAIVAENVTIKIQGKIGTQYPRWKKIDDNCYQIDIRYLMAESRMDFWFEVMLPEKQIESLEKHQQYTLAEAQLQFYDFIGEKIIKKSAKLEIKLFKEQIFHSEPNMDVIALWLRMRGICAIKQAHQLCSQVSYNEALTVITKIIREIQQQNDDVKQSSKQIYFDLQQSQIGATSQNFSRFGSNQMIQFVTNNLMQSGLSSYFEKGQLMNQKNRPGSYIMNTNQFQLQLIQANRYITDSQMLTN